MIFYRQLTSSILSTCLSLTTGILLELISWTFLWSQTLMLILRYNVPRLLSSISQSDHVSLHEKMLLINNNFCLATLPIRILQERVECGSFKLRFSHDEHLFGIENTTFYVNVFGFTTPFVLQISFSQHRTLDLLQFFVTFSRYIVRFSLKMVISLIF